MRIAGVILAGGLSTRMGQDKATLLLEKKTLLTRNMTLLSALNLSDNFVSGEYEGFQYIPDIESSSGPIGGIHACVETLFNEFDALFIIPVDMPLLTSVECLTLLEKFKNFQEGVFYEKALFPMILPLTNELKAYLENILNSKEYKHRSIYRLIKTIGLQSIKLQTENSFRFHNSNTPQEWADCLETFKTLNETKDQS